MRVAARAAVGEYREAQRQRVRTHVPAVGEHGHGVEPPAADDLHQHHADGEPQGAAGIAFGQRVAVVEAVFVAAGGGEGVQVHGGTKRDGVDTPIGYMIPPWPMYTGIESSC